MGYYSPYDTNSQIIRIIFDMNNSFNRLNSKNGALKSTSKYGTMGRKEGKVQMALKKH